MNRRNLDKAQKDKKDEFYTQYEDVEREMNAYFDYNPNIFKNKVILCPCDDPEWSNFTKYFAQNFEKLGLNKLITTSYANRAKFDNLEIPPTEFETSSPQFDESKTHTHGKVFTLGNVRSNPNPLNISNLHWEYLQGDGDFRTNEVKKLRDQADFIITNPPFSLLREFIPWILEADKKFIILGNQNTITYKDIFPLIMQNKIWLGNRFNERVNGRNLTYRVPNFYDMNASEMFTVENGEKYITVPGTGWFTNVDHGKRHKPISLMSLSDNIKYSKHKDIRENGYRKYDNFDAVDIPFVDSIPSDYKGNMGVPITFLGKYCPEQFEIIRFRKGDDGKDLAINGISPYFRIIIRSKNA
jgi:hypothetical protein